MVQGLALAIVFGVLIALPIPHSFFDDFGWVVGPLAWIACSFVTARFLALPLSFALFAAAAGGIAGLIAFLVGNHTFGLLAGLLVFAASCGSYEPEPPPAPEAPTPPELGSARESAAPGRAE